MPLLGAHVSVAGGLPRAFERAADLGCAAIQVFVKNASRWQGRSLGEDEVTAFGSAWSGSDVGAVVAHGSYLLNLAAPAGEVLERSRAGLADELERCRRLGLAGLVIHPGAHLGRGEAAGIAAVAASLDAVLGELDPSPTRVLLEVTAGQGTCLGYRLEHLEGILERSAARRHLAVCLDTCHLLAGGYPLDDPAAVEGVIDEAVGRFGLAGVACVHLNDSRHPRGSRKDRHANIGEGTIGLDSFAVLLGDGRLGAVPMLVETPAGEDLAEHRQDLARLRSLT